MRSPTTLRIWPTEPFKRLTDIDGLNVGLCRNDGIVTPPRRGIVVLMRWIKYCGSSQGDGSSETGETTGR